MVKVTNKPLLGALVKHLYWTAVAYLATVALANQIHTLAFSVYSYHGSM